MSNVSIDESLINYEKEKRKEEKLCLQFETNAYEHLMFAMNAVCSYVAFRANQGKIPYKVYMFCHIFIHDY